jgi:electron transfer flavoprotein beta subunit
MDIVVCIKRVPATDATIKIAADGKSIDPTGVTVRAQRLRRVRPRAGAAHQGTTRRRLGDGRHDRPQGRQEAAATTPRARRRQGRAAVDRPSGCYDGASTAAALAAWIKTVPCNLVLCGRQAVDSDNNQLPANLAARLGFACVTEVTKLTLENGVFTAERDIEGAREVVTCKTPAVISCQKGLNEPRYANLKGIMAAKKKPFVEQPAQLGSKAIEIVSLTLPAARAAGKIVGNGRRRRAGTDRRPAQRSQGPLIPRRTPMSNIVVIAEVRGGP